MRHMQLGYWLLPSSFQRLAAAAADAILLLLQGPCFLGPPKRGPTPSSCPHTWPASKVASQIGRSKVYIRPWVTASRSPCPQGPTEQLRPRVFRVRRVVRSPETSYCLGRSNSSRHSLGLPNKHAG